MTILPIKKSLRQEGHPVNVNTNCHINQVLYNNLTNETHYPKAGVPTNAPVK